jgi:hypothetical protein
MTSTPGENIHTWVSNLNLIFNLGIIFLKSKVSTYGSCLMISYLKELSFFIYYNKVLCDFTLTFKFSYSLLNLTFYLSMRHE